MSTPTPASHAHGGPRVYLAVLAALLALTAITVGASYIHFGSGSVNVVVALGIATLKGSLVALYFMHLRYDKPLSSIIFVAGLLFLGLFLAFCFVDLDSREPVNPYNGKPPAGGPAAPAKK